MSENTQINVSTTTEIVNVDVTETLQPVSLECFFAHGSAQGTVVNVSENVLNIDLNVTETQAQNVTVDVIYPTGAQGPKGESLWGTISGTLSTQTDLWRYLSAVGTSNFDITTLNNYLSTNTITLCSTNTRGRILSAGIDLFNIFRTTDSDAQTLTYVASSYLLSISNGNTVNLSSINSTFASNSGKYESVYTNVQSNSANWNIGYNIGTAYQSISSSFATNTALNAASSILTPLTLTNTLTGLLVTNTDFNNYQTSIAAATATLLPTSVYQNASGNWESTYTTVCSNSANWNQGYNIGTAYQNASGSFVPYSYVNTNFLALSGGLVSGPVRINNNLTVFGNITASGTATYANTVFTTTSSLTVVHIGSGPAVWIGNNGDGDIASFYDIDQNIEILHVGGQNGTFPNVGVKTSQPNKDFTVKGEISASNTIYDNVGNSTQWNQAYNVATIYQTASSSFATNTTVSTVSSQLLLTSIYQNASGNWQSTYQTVASLSTTWGTGGSGVGGIFGNIQILSNPQTVLSANVFSSFYKNVTANNSFTFTGFTSGLTITVYLSGKHNIPYRQYFPANTSFNNNGQANYVYTFPNKLTKAVIQNIGDRYIGVTNIITTDVPSITSTGNIILDGLFGLLLAENRTTLRQEPI